MVHFWARKIMAGDVNTDEALRKAAAAAQANPNVMFDAFKATNLAYAFQFAMQAKPRFVVAEEGTLQQRMEMLHAEKCLIMSVNPTSSGYLIFFYAKE